MDKKKRITKEDLRLAAVARFGSTANVYKEGTMYVVGRTGDLSTTLPSFGFIFVTLGRTAAEAMEALTAID